MASEMDGLTNIVVGDTVGAVIIAAPVGVVGDAAIAVEPAATPSGIKPKPSPKTGRKRSEAWDHFSPPILHEDGTKTTCKYCPQTHLCGSKVYGTSNMLGHCRICKHNPDIDHASNQTKPNLHIHFLHMVAMVIFNLANLIKLFVESGWGKCW